MSLPDARFRLAATDAEAVRALQRAREQVRGLGTDGRRTAGQLQTMSGATRAAGASSGAFGRGIQNAAFQVGDFAVQVGMGTSAVRAMSMQLPQLLGGFGVLGAVVGAAVAVVGALATSLFNTSDAAEEAEDGISRLTGALESVRGDVGRLATLQERLNDLHEQQGGAATNAARMVIASTEKEFNARKALLILEVEILRIRGQEQREAIRNLRDQQNLAEQAARVPLADYSAGNDFPGLEGIVYTGPRSVDDILVNQGDVSGIINEQRENFESLRGSKDYQERQRQITRLIQELRLSEIAAEEATKALNGVFEMPGTEGSGGGGGSGGGSGQRVKTPVEIAIEAQKTAIHELVADTRSSLSSALGAWGGYFDDLVSLSGSKSQRLLTISKSFGAAMALIDAWQAHNAVLKDPTLPWWARIASALKVAAAGFGAVSAIKGVTAGGGGGGGNTSGGAATAAPVNNPMQVDINMTGPLAQLFADQVGPLFDMLTAEAGRRGLAPTVRYAG